MQVLTDMEGLGFKKKQFNWFNNVFKPPYNQIWFQYILCMVDSILGNCKPNPREEKCLSIMYLEPLLTNLKTLPLGIFLVILSFVMCLYVYVLNWTYCVPQA